MNATKARQLGVGALSRTKISISKSGSGGSPSASPRMRSSGITADFGTMAMPSPPSTAACNPAVEELV